MSAPPPSFSSFPPTFSSFPDIEAGTSKRKDASSPCIEEKKTKTQNDSKTSRRDRERRKEKITHGDERHERKHKKHFREKYSGDDALRDSTSHLTESAADLATRSFYSDRKGDALNITYGGLHSGDVPKHHLVASKCSLS